MWSVDVDLGPTFAANGLDQILAQTVMYHTGPSAGIVNLSIDGDDNRFTPAFEATGRIIFEASDGETLEVTIGGVDTEEPYSWTPTNSDEVIAFANHVLTLLTDTSVTLTLTDEPTEWRWGPP